MILSDQHLWPLSLPNPINVTSHLCCCHQLKQIQMLLRNSNQIIQHSLIDWFCKHIDKVWLFRHLSRPVAQIDNNVLIFVVTANFLCQRLKRSGNGNTLKPIASTHPLNQLCCLVFFCECFYNITLLLAHKVYKIVGFFVTPLKKCGKTIKCCFGKHYLSPKMY